MAQRVLIVEDHPLVSAGFKSILLEVNPDCKVDEAFGYELAVDRLSIQSFDLLFVDIDLRSSHSGVDLLRWAREENISAKIIMLSANDDADVILNCISAGASGYITKSFDDQASVKLAISTVLSDGVYLPAAIFRNAGASGRSVACMAEEWVMERLSPRMQEVLYYLCQGLSNKEIARKMQISEGTVRKNYVSSLLRAFKVARRTSLVIEVARRGIKVAAPKPVRSQLSLS